MVLDDKVLNKIIHNTTGLISPNDLMNRTATIRQSGFGAGQQNHEKSKSRYSSLKTDEVKNEFRISQLKRYKNVSLEGKMNSQTRNYHKLR